MSRVELSRREFVRTGAVAAAGLAAGGASATAHAKPLTPDAKDTRSYNPEMEYRRLGKTGLVISAVSLGGHWKKLPAAYGTPEFKKNRADVVSACIEHGINMVDACTGTEILAYAEALKGRREKMYFFYAWDVREARVPEWTVSLDKMKEGFKLGLKEAGLDYVDCWRLMLHEQTRRQNTEKEIEVAMEALVWAKKEGLARHTGISSHDRPWIAEAVAKYPQIEAVITPYTAASKEKPTGSLFEAFRQHDVGFVGIKPFASGSVFKSRGAADSPTKADDDERARVVLRYVLSCDVLAACIPGLITIDQVKNAAAAVKDRRELDVADARKLEEIAADMRANLAPAYRFLNDWEWV